MANVHQLSKENQMGVWYQGKEYWIPAIPYPFFTTKGLPFWKRFNEKNWRPQCVCGRIFETLEDYNAHIVYNNTLWGLADGVKTSNVSITNNKEDQ
jgi:hypothetical protein